MRTLALSVLLTLAVAAASAEPPRLESLFSKAGFTHVKLSPDGKTLAVRRLARGERYALQFVSLPGLETVGSLDIDLDFGKNEIGNYWWATNDRLVGEILQFEPGSKFPVSYGELFATDSDGRNAVILFGARATSDRTIVLGEYLHRLPAEPDKVLVRTETWKRKRNAIPDVKKIDIRSGKVGYSEVKGLAPTTRFLTDNEGLVRLMLTDPVSGDFRVAFRPDDEWIDVPAEALGTDFWPATVAGDNGSFYSLDRYGTDKWSLFRFSIDEMKQELVYEHDTVDISRVVPTTDWTDVIALRINNGYPSYLLMDSDHEERDVLKSLLDYFPGQQVEILSRTDDGRKWIVATHSDRDAGTFYLFDRDNRSMGKLFTQHADISAESLSPVEPISYPSADGLTIHGYFTPAKGIESNAPMVVMVHGGPRARDHWIYNPEVQAFATRGFAVLQVNYRGSTGYGAEFMNAGNGEWGRKVQQDIITGVKWAIAEGRADPDRICIMGASFGAYSAVMSASIEPDLFQCVVANAGVYDLELLYKKGDIKDLFFGEDFIEEMIGSDEEQLAAYSPVEQVHRLTAPVLVAHGKKDPRTPFVNARRLVSAMKKAGIPHETMFESGEGHGFYTSETQVAYMQRAIDFVSRHTAAAPDTRQ